MIVEFKKNGHKEGENFSEKTFKHHKPISIIVNKFKHANPELSPILFNYDLGEVVHGYTILSAEGEDMIAPDNEIHNNYNGQKTGSSFNYLIRTSVGLIYFYSYHLNQILFKHRNNTAVGGKRDFSTLARLAEKNPTALFPNEYDLYMGSFDIKEKSVTIRYPVENSLLRPKNTSARFSTYVPINTRTGIGKMKLPYFGENEK